MWPGNVSDINIEINCYCISSQALEMTLKRIILFDKQIRPWFSIGAVNRWKWFCCFLLGQLRCIGKHLFLWLKNIWSINKHEQQYNSRSKKMMRWSILREISFLMIIMLPSWSSTKRFMNFNLPSLTRKIIIHYKIEN